jgi:spermidine dehydrogenase
LRASGFASCEAEQPACNFRGTPPPAIVYAVPEFVGGISVNMPLDISRRDFLSGSALIIAAGLTPLAQLRAASTRYYPPALTGLRGSHTGSFEVAHQLAREGKVFDFSGIRVKEKYDLVVVGGGISGLAAAWFYREAHGKSAKILILDNYDDCGGHAKRNEFEIDGKHMLIGYGGSEGLEAPKENFSKHVNYLMKALGVHLNEFDTAFDRKLYASLGLTEGVFFDRETFGVDRLVSGDPTGGSADPVPGNTVRTKSIEAFVAEFPLSDDARKRLADFFATPKDYLAGKTVDEKVAYLQATSYRDYLRRDAGLGDEAVKYFEAKTHDYLALGIDAIPAHDAYDYGYLGFNGLGLDAEEEGEAEEPYIYHFPDGNASIARLLVRSLIPGVAGGHTMDDIVLADFDYDELDVAGSPVRLRLNSTVIGVKNPKGPVDIGYVRQGALHRVAAKRCVLACYNMIIPFLMPDLPKKQKAALALSVKAPLVYANVPIRNWQSFVKLGVHNIYSPSAFFPLVKLDYPVALGGYTNPRKPDEPIVLHMVYVPVTPNRGLSDVEQFRLGRQKLLEMTFDDFETKITDQLDRMLGGGGFQSARDIAAITVNRWPHGYSYTFNSIYDKKSAGLQPYEIARQRRGRVAIANSDAGWNPYAHEAIDQAWRAVNELRRS